MKLSEKITFAREARGLKKKELADAIGRSPSAITQLESGDSKSLLVETEMALSRVLRVAREYFTSNENDWEKYRFENYRAEKFMGAADVVEPAALTSPAPVQGVGAQPNPPHERDYALIPQYHVSGECGSGYLNGHEEVKGGLAFKRDWLARMSLKPDSLSVIYACGLSMAPTINDGEVLLVDHDQREPRDGQVFAIERDGELLIKRLARHPAGGWICRSDNPDKIRYADWEPVSAEQIGILRIVGRIVWRGGAM